MVIKLTNDTVRTLQAGDTGDTIYPDSDRRHGVPGLCLRVREGGSRTFMIQWRQGRKQRRFTLGKAGVMTLDDARKKARKMLVGIEDGADPIAEKAKARIDDQQEFSVLMRTYLKGRAGDMKPSSLEQCTLHLQKYWKPFHQLPVSRIEKAMVAAELRKIAEDRGGVAANRARSTLSSFYGWLIGEGICEENPVIGTNKVGDEKSRDRVLSDAELVEIWQAAPDSDYGRIVRLLMLTVQRRDEIAGLRDEEANVTDKLISLPPERTKNSRAHEVPLSAPALEILAKQPRRDDREFVFGEGEGAFSGFSKAKLRLDEQILERRKANTVDPSKVKPMADWTLHDLRRTGSTRMADLGVQPHIIEAILNHVSGHKSGVAGIYNRSTYAAEKRAALDLWATHVLTIVAQAEGANVTKLRRA
jgi:integrase